MQVNQPLVNAHLKLVPGLAALTVGRFAGGDVEDFGGQTNRATHSQTLVFGAFDQLAAHFLQRLQLA